MHEDGTTPERWLPVVGWEGAYEVSNHGRVRSLDRVVDRNGVPMAVRGRILSGAPGKNGYPAVHLHGEGGTRRTYHHQLVLAAFVGPRPGKLVTRHLDGDPTNNHLSNLCYGTQVENMADAARHGRQSPPPVHRGTANCNAKLTDALVAEILSAKDSLRAIARRYGVDRSTVKAIRSGHTWRHVPRVMAPK